MNSVTVFLPNNRSITYETEDPVEQIQKRFQDLAHLDRGSYSVKSARSGVTVVFFVRHIVSVEIEEGEVRNG